MAAGLISSGCVALSAAGTQTHVYLEFVAVASVLTARAQDFFPDPLLNNLDLLEKLLSDSENGDNAANASPAVTEEVCAVAVLHQHALSSPPRLMSAMMPRYMMNLSL